MFPRRDRLFDNPIFQRMERYDTQPSAGIQPVRCGLHHTLHFAQFVIYLDPDGLEAALGRMLFFPQGCGRHRAPDNLRQLQCRVDWVLLTFSDKGRTDPSGITLFPINVKNPAQFRLFIVIDDIPCGFSLTAVHPHIQRRIQAV